MIKMDSQTQPNFTSLGCVVKATFPGIKEECSTCGILLNPWEGIILSHGSILTDICLSEDVLLSKIKNGQIISNSDLGGNIFDVLVDKCWRQKNATAQYSITGGREANLVNAAHLQRDPSFTSLRCTLLGAFRNVDFHNTVCRIMPEDSWSFANASQEESITPTYSSNTTKGSDDGDKGVPFHLLSYFVLLRCDPLVYQQDKALSLPLYGSSPFNNVVTNRANCCSIGSEAEIISTPFGGLNPSVFFNSYSRGAISNVSGPNNCWILTDARCIPGSEGGPLFTVQPDMTRHLAGVVVASLCWKNKEWVGLSLACGIESVCHALSSNITQSVLPAELLKLDRLEPHPSSSKKSQLQTSTPTNCSSPVKWLPRVVLVKVGRVWGSGFVIDDHQGLILTCSHVIKEASPPELPILVRVHSTSKMFKASVVYRQTSSEIEPLDLALIKCPEAMRYLTPSARPKVVPPVIGQRVWVCGHAVFNTDLGLQPSVSTGVISKVVTVKHQDIMVQSTCAVHAGVSGGPLLDRDGNLVGIVVCNTVDKGSNSTYPHVNFSIPAMTVWPYVQHYIKTGDASMMKSFKTNDLLVKKLWALDTSLESEFAVKSKL